MIIRLLSEKKGELLPTENDVIVTVLSVTESWHAYLYIINTV